MATYLVRDVTQEDIKGFKLRCLLHGSDPDTLLKAIIRTDIFDRLLFTPSTSAVQAERPRCGSSLEMSPPRATE